MDPYLLTFNSFIIVSEISVHSFAVYRIPAAASTLHHWRPPFCPSIYFLVLNYSLMLSLYISHPVSVGVFLRDPFLSSPFPLPLFFFCLSLISCYTLASVFFPNSLCSAEPQLQTYILKEPKHLKFFLKKEEKISPKSYLPSTATLFPSLSPPPTPFTRFSPLKMLFVYHHWSILAPGCCISISALTSADVCSMRVCVREERCR